MRFKLSASCMALVTSRISLKATQRISIQAGNPKVRRVGPTQSKHEKSKQGNAQSIRGRYAHSFFFRLQLAHGQNREVFIPAGFAAKSRYMQQPPQNSQRAVHILGGDAL